MNPILKTALAVMALSTGLAAQAGSISSEAKVIEGRSQVYLTWNAPNGYTEFKVIRYVQTDDIGHYDGNSGVELAIDLSRCDYIDHGVMPGRYVYVIMAKTNGIYGFGEGDNGWHDDTNNVWRYAEASVGNPNFGLSRYSIDITYETTTQELMDDWGTLEQVWDDSAAKYDAVSGQYGTFLHCTGSWPQNWLGTQWKYNSLSADNTTSHDNHSATSITNHYNPRPTQTWLSESRYTGAVHDEQGNVKAGVTNNGQVLDGNRYIWLDQLENFVNWDTNADDYFPWAGRGLSWRGSDVGREKADKSGERCWYINVRVPDKNVYGVIQVFDQDLDKSKRPYRGAPVFLQPGITHNESLGSYEGLGIDNSYSLAFSENGRSYILRAGKSSFDINPSQEAQRNKSGYLYERYLAMSTTITGNCHTWRPINGNPNHQYRGDGDYNFYYDHFGLMKEDWHMPGANAWLLSVKGNMAYSNKKGSKDPDFSTQDYAYMYRMPIYNINTSLDEILIRRDKITNYCNNGFIRVNVKGLKAFGGVKNTANFNYIIPMAGNDREDFFVQMRDNYILFIPNSVMNAYKGTELTQDSKEKAEFSKKVVNVTEANRLKVDNQYVKLSGGCTFEYNGEVFLVLPSTRIDGKNYGDFTVFRINNRDNINSFSLEPVYEYYCRKGGNYNATNAPMRTFISAESYPSKGFVSIFTYVPGQMIAKYTLNIPERPQDTPSVRHTIHYEKIAEGGSYRNKNLVKVNGQAVGISSGVNNDYKVATALNGHFSWNNNNKASYQPVNYNANTAWTINGHQFKIFQAQQSGTPSSWDCWRDQYHNHTTANNFDILNHRDLKRNYELSCHLQPVSVRQHNGFIEQSIGDTKYANNYFNYSPNNPSVSVKVFSPAGGSGQSQYRVDLNFTEAAAATASNGENVPVDYYKIFIQYGGAGDWYQITGFNTIIGDANAYWAGRTNAKSSDDPKKLGAWQNINYIPGQDVIYGDYNFSQWPTVLQTANGKANEPGVDRAVLSFYTTDSRVTNAKYIVQPVYAAGASPQSELTQYGYGEAWPTVGTTGVDNILVDDDDEAIYYNLQGVRVDADNLTPGFYLQNKGGKTVKVYVQ